MYFKSSSHCTSFKVKRTVLKDWSHQTISQGFKYFWHNSYQGCDWSPYALFWSVWRLYQALVYWSTRDCFLHWMGFLFYVCSILQRVDISASLSEVLNREVHRLGETLCFSFNVFLKFHQCQNLSVVLKLWSLRFSSWLDQNLTWILIWLLKRVLLHVACLFKMEIRSWDLLHRF